MAIVVHLIVKIMFGYLMSANNLFYHRMLTIPLRPIRSLCHQAGSSTSALRTKSVLFIQSFIYHLMLKFLLVQALKVIHLHLKNEFWQHIKKVVLWICQEKWHTIKKETFSFYELNVYLKNVETFNLID